MSSPAHLQRRPALAHREPLAAPSGAAAMTERPFEGKLILRGKPELIGEAAAGVLGEVLPAKVNATATGKRGTAQWLGPDEWLIVTAPGAETALLADLSAALSAKHSQVVDVSDYYTTVVLSGARARDMLMKVTTIDFHTRAFKPGMGVTTNFARTVAWARQTGDAAFDIIVRISMADYLWCLLAEAGHEWGLPLQTPKGGDVKLHLPHFESDATDNATAIGSDLEIA